MPTIIWGWHFGYKYPQGSTGLPISLTEEPTINAGVYVSHYNSGNFEKYDLAWDIWLSNEWDPNPSDPSAEIMIWLN